MWRTAILYGVALAAGALALQWLEYQVWARFHALEVYLALVAAAFLALGIWVGVKLFRGPVTSGPFEPNARARETLGITDREYEVLRLMAAGRANKEIARQMRLRESTVKMHLHHIFEKLKIDSRTQLVLAYSSPDKVNGKGTRAAH